MITTIGDTTVHPGAKCGLAGFGRESGNCKNRSCGRFAAVLLSGYCVECAALAGVEPAKRCGCQPIRLLPPAPATPQSSTV